DTESGEMVTRRLQHENGEARAFYASLPAPALVGIETTGYTPWFGRLMAALNYELWVGDAAQIRARAVRRQKTDTRDAEHLLELLSTHRFPRLWIPSSEQRDLRQLLKHRHKLVRMVTALKNQLHFLAMSQGVCRKSKLWSERGRRTGVSGAGPLGQPAAAGVASTAGPTAAADRGTGHGGGASRSCESGGGGSDDSAGRGAGHRPGLRADSGSGRALSEQPAGGELSGPQPQRILQRW